MENQHSWFSAFQEAVTSGYINGKPRHLELEQDSFLSVMDEIEFLSKTPLEVDEMLRSKVMVILEKNGGQFSFDRQLLHRLSGIARLDRVIQLHGAFIAL
jgi:hypothetical protein